MQTRWILNYADWSIGIGFLITNENIFNSRQQQLQSACYYERWLRDLQMNANILTKRKLGSSRLQSVSPQIQTALRIQWL